VLLLTSAATLPTQVVAAGPSCREQSWLKPTNDEIDNSRFTGTPVNPTSFWQFTGFMDGKEVQLKRFKSRATLVVNVGSE